MSTKPRRDTAREVTERIAAQLEKGVAPWVQPWSAAPPQRMPLNAHTGKPYRGANVLLLWSGAQTAGYDDPRWVTFRQARELGGSVRRGEKGTPVVFWRFVERSKDGSSAAQGPEAEARRFALCRTYTVFNIAQCEGLALAAPAARESLAPIDALVTRLGAEVRHGGDRAVYFPSADRIQMPALERFEHREAYPATLLPELVHWTGHERRLARTFGERFGDDAYAAEELVAELGAAFLCAELGVRGTLQHAEYLETWLRVLRADRCALFTAARHAQAAMELVLGSAEGEHEDAGETSAD